MKFESHASKQMASNPYLQSTMQVDKANLDSKLSFKNTRNLQSEVSLVHQSRTDPNINKGEFQQQHHTTGKKGNLNEIFKLQGINDTKSKKLSFLNKFDGKTGLTGTITNDAISNFTKKNKVEGNSDGGKIFRREQNQQQRSFQKQLQNLRQGQAQSLEAQNPHKPYNINSNASQNQSMQQLRQQSDLDQKTPPQFIHLKQVFGANSNQSIPHSKKNYIIFNKKQDDARKEMRDQESRNTSMKDSQGTFNSAMNTSKQKFIEKTKNVYSQFQSKNISNSEINNYADLGIKGMKSRTKQAQFMNSRNSQLSNGSNNSYHNNPAGNHNEIVMNTYGGPVNSQNQQAKMFGSKGSVGKDSGKNSYHNTKTSFGVKQSLTHEAPQMEVRGNNMGGSMTKLNRSNYNKFVPPAQQSQVAKMNSSKTFMSQQTGKHQSVVLSKHKNTKQKERTSFKNQSQLSLVQQQSIESHKVTNLQTPVQKTDRKQQVTMTEGNISRRENNQIKAKNASNLARAESYQIGKEFENSQTSINFKDDLKNLKVLKTRKSEQLTANKDKSSIGVIKGNMSQQNQKQQRINSQQRAGDRENQERDNSLPHIFCQQSEGLLATRARSNDKNKSANSNIQFRGQFLENNNSSTSEIHLFDNKLDVIGSNANQIESQYRQKSHKQSIIENQGSIEPLKQNQNKASIINNISMRKQYTVNERTLERDELKNNITNTSMSIHRPETQNNSAVRKTQQNNYNKQSIGNFSRGREGEKIGNHNGIQLVPLHGAPPGTANTQGNNRQVFRNPAQSEQNLQYNFVSQQCNSEVYQKQMSYQNLNNQQYYYDQSENLNNNNFNESFDQQFDPQFEQLDKMDPTEDVGDIHNIQTKPIPRSQKSQGTYRQNSKKINHMINKFHNFENYSMSEMYDFQSVNEGIMVNSQLEDIQTSLAPKPSHTSEITKLSKEKIVEKHSEDHPFNGPKLHLFKKGQSKSSQMKQRNVKTGEKQRNVFEVNSQNNVVYSQQDAQSNQGGYFPQRQQMSEGGPNYQQSIGTLQRLSKTKKGHVNISEILKENRHNGLLANNIQSNLDQMYTDSKSQDSQGIISQSSFEIGQGTPLVLKGTDNQQQPILDFDNGSKNGTIKNGIKSSIEPDEPVSGHVHKTPNQNFSEIMAFETRSQQCPSQMSSLQQNVDPEKSFNLPQVNTSNINMGSFLQNEPNMNSPYILNNQNNNSIIQKESSDMSMNNSVLQMQGENSSSTRPNTTNPIGNHIYIVNNTDSRGGQRKSNVKGKNGISNFQHPKVGKNSKYPEVFKQNSTNSQSKNNSMTMNQSVYQTGTKIDPHNLTSNERLSKKKLAVKDKNSSSKIFAQYLQNEEPVIKQEHQDGPEQKQMFEPKQTGDFPTPQQIQQFNVEIEQEKKQVHVDDEYQNIKNEINNNNKNGKQQDTLSCQVSQKNKMFSILHQDESSTNDKFQSLNNIDLNKKKLHQDTMPQGSEEMNNYYYASNNNNQMQSDGDQAHQIKSTQVQGGKFKTRATAKGVVKPAQESNLPAIGKATMNFKQMNEIKNNQRQTIQHNANTNFEEFRQLSFDKPYEVKNKQNSEQVSMNQQVNPLTLNHKLQIFKNAEQLERQQKSKQDAFPANSIPTKTKQKMQTIEDSSKIKFNVPIKEISQSDFKKDKISSQGSDYQISNKIENKNEEEKSMHDTGNNHFISIAQTPCFAETPYTTDQFKGYKVSDVGNVPSMMQTGFSRHSKYDEKSVNQNNNTSEQED